MNFLFLFRYYLCGNQAVFGASGGGDSTPGGASDVWLMEDGTSGWLMEDGTSFWLIES